MKGSMKLLRAARISCRGEEVATVTDCLFDESTWSVRFFVLIVGNPKNRKRVIVEPKHIAFIDWDRNLIELGMTCEHLMNRPMVAGHLHTGGDDVAHEKYFKWPFFWTGAGTFGV